MLGAERPEARPARAEVRGPARGGRGRLRGARERAAGRAGTRGHPAGAARPPGGGRRLAPGAGRADRGRAVRAPAPPGARRSRPRPDPGRQHVAHLPDAAPLPRLGRGLAVARAPSAEGAPGRGGGACDRTNPGAGGRPNAGGAQARPSPARGCDRTNPGGVRNRGRWGLCHAPDRTCQRRGLALTFRASDPRRPGCGRARTGSGKAPCCATSSTGSWSWCRRCSRSASSPS